MKTLLIAAVIAAALPATSALAQACRPSSR